MSAYPHVQIWQMHRSPRVRNPLIVQESSSSYASGCSCRTGVVPEEFNCLPLLLLDTPKEAVPERRKGEGGTLPLGNWETLPPCCRCMWLYMSKARADIGLPSLRALDAPLLAVPGLLDDVLGREKDIGRVYRC